MPTHNAVSCSVLTTFVSQSVVCCVHCTVEQRETGHGYCGGSALVVYDWPIFDSVQRKCKDGATSTKRKICCVCLVMHHGVKYIAGCGMKCCEFAGRLAGATNSTSSSDIGGISVVSNPPQQCPFSGHRLDKAFASMNHTTISAAPASLPVPGTQRPTPGQLVVQAADCVHAVATAQTRTVAIGDGTSDANGAGSSFGGPAVHEHPTVAQCPRAVTQCPHASGNISGAQLSSCSADADANAVEDNAGDSNASGDEILPSAAKKSRSVRM